MQRREVGELAHRRLDPGVDHHRLAEALTAVDDPMTHDVGVAEAAVERRAQLGGVDTVTGRRELARGKRLVVRVEQRQLQAARPGVDDEDSHRGLRG